MIFEIVGNIEKKKYNCIIIITTTFLNMKYEARWWRRKIQEVEFKWINRTGNEVADKLTKMDTLELFEFYYYIQFHLCCIMTM